MSWINTAILSAAVFGAVNIIDSHLLSKRLPSFRVYLLPIGVIYFIYGFILLYLFPFPEGTSTATLLIAIFSGILRTASVSIMLYTFKKEEVSRVIPIVYTYPLFVAIMAVPLLGESLRHLEWLAIVIVVAGAVIASFRQSASGPTTWRGKTFLLLLGAALLLAMADITSKHVLASISFWNLFCINAFCMSIPWLLLSTRRHIFRRLMNMKQRNSSLAIIAFNELLSPLAIVLSLWSIERGPVSLVSTIVSSRPIFVLIYALILSRALPTFLEWQPGRRMMAYRIIATTMVVSGIVIIHLT